MTLSIVYQRQQNVSKALGNSLDPKSVLIGARVWLSLVFTQYIDFLLDIPQHDVIVYCSLQGR